MPLTLYTNWILPLICIPSISSHILSSFFTLHSISQFAKCTKSLYYRIACALALTYNSTNSSLHIAHHTVSLQASQPPTFRITQLSLSWATYDDEMRRLCCRHWSMRKLFHTILWCGLNMKWKSRTEYTWSGTTFGYLCIFVGFVCILAWLLSGILVMDFNNCLWFVGFLGVNTN